MFWPQRRDREIAALALANFHSQARGVLYSLERAARFDMKESPFGRRREPSRSAHEKLESDLMLERDNHIADGRLRNADELGGTRHRTVKHQGSKAL